MVGMGDRQINELRMILSGPGGSSCAIAPDDRAQACFVDLDGCGAQEELGRQRRLYPRRPVLLTGLRRPPDTVVGDDLFVPKPMPVEVLVSAVAQLRGRVRAATGRVEVGAAVPSRRRAPAPPLPAPGTLTAPATADYDPDRYLQGLVTKAGREALVRRCAVHLEGPWPSITLLPGCGTAIVTGGPSTLDAFAPQYGLADHARVTFTPAPLFSPNSPDAVSLESLVWQLAVQASAGRVPVGTEVDRPVALSDWPNFTRLAPTRWAMNIAALWTQEPSTLEDTAAGLGISLREVCTFYSAVRAVGLVAEATRTVPAGQPQPAEVGPRRGLLRRVFDKLRVA